MVLKFIGKTEASSVRLFVTLNSSWGLFQPGNKAVCFKATVCFRGGPLGSVGQISALCFTLACNRESLGPPESSLAGSWWRVSSWNAQIRPSCSDSPPPVRLSSTCLGELFRGEGELLTHHWTLHLCFISSPPSQSHCPSSSLRQHAVVG